MSRTKKVFTESDLVPPHKMRLGEYKRLWYHGKMKKRLWALYNNNKTAYIAAYRPAKPDFCKEQEYGMKVFRTFERTIMNQYWEAKGQIALLESLDILRTKSATSLKAEGALDSDLPVLISMDIEGSQDFNATGCQGINELGIAILDMRDLYSQQQKKKLPTIHSANYILGANVNRRKFLFYSFSQRIDGSDTANIRNIVSSTLFIPDDRLSLMQGTKHRRVILVGHGVQAETRFLEELGLPLSTLPTVIGTADTNSFAFPRTGKQHLRLEHLIDVLGIPLHRSSLGNGRSDHLHCAGNDANYTLRALLALLEIEARESEDLAGALSRIAREGVPVAAPGLVDEKSDDLLESCGGDVGLAGMFFGEHAELEG